MSIARPREGFRWTGLLTIGCTLAALGISGVKGLHALRIPTVRLVEDRQSTGKLFADLASTQRRLESLRGSALPMQRRLVAAAEGGSPAVWRELRARCAAIEGGVLSMRGSMFSDTAELQRILTEVEISRARVQHPASSPLERAECYERILDLPGRLLHFDSPIRTQWLRDVFTESGDPIVARKLAVVAGRMAVDGDVVAASIHLCTAADDIARTSAVAGIARMLDMQVPERAHIIAQLRNMAQYDTSNKVREKALEELGRLQK